jgi:hypothetical protein
MGWGWQPGGSWTGLNNSAMLPTQNGPGVGRRLPMQPPTKGSLTVIPVNMKPLVRSELKSADSFEFRRDSAGMGIPRDTLGRLDKFSEHAMTHGSASTEVFVSTPGMNNGMNGRAGMSSTAMPVVTIHRGVAPSRGSESELSDGSISAGSGRAPSRPTATTPTATSPRAPSAAPGGRPPR